eukprot:CFRG6903T1
MNDLENHYQDQNVNVDDAMGHDAHDQQHPHHPHLHDGAHEHHPQQDMVDMSHHQHQQYESELSYVRSDLDAHDPNEDQGLLLEGLNDPLNDHQLRELNGQLAQPLSGLSLGDQSQGYMGGQISSPLDGNLDAQLNGEIQFQFPGQPSLQLDNHQVNSPLNGNLNYSLGSMDAQLGGQLGSDNLGGVDDGMSGGLGDSVPGSHKQEVYNDDYPPLSAEPTDQAQQQHEQHQQHQQHQPPLQVVEHEQHYTSDEPYAHQHDHYRQQDSHEEYDAQQHHHEQHLQHQLQQQQHEHHHVQQQQQQAHHPHHPPLMQHDHDILEGELHHRPLSEDEGSHLLNENGDLHGTGQHTQQNLYSVIDQDEHHRQQQQHQQEQQEQQHEQQIPPSSQHEYEQTHQHLSSQHQHVQQLQQQHQPQQHSTEEGPPSPLPHPVDLESSAVEQEAKIAHAHQDQVNAQVQAQAQAQAHAHQQRALHLAHQAATQAAQQYQQQQQLQAQALIQAQAQAQAQTQAQAQAQVQASGHTGPLGTQQYHSVSHGQHAQHHNGILGASGYQANGTHQPQQNGLLQSTPFHTQQQQQQLQSTSSTLVVPNQPGTTLAKPKKKSRGYRTGAVVCYQDWLHDASPDITLCCIKCGVDWRFLEGVVKKQHKVKMATLANGQVVVRQERHRKCLAMCKPPPEHKSMQDSQLRHAFQKWTDAMAQNYSTQDQQSTMLDPTPNLHRSEQLMPFDTYP